MDVIRVRDLSEAQVNSLVLMMTQNFQPKQKKQEQPRGWASQQEWQMQQAQMNAQHAFTYGMNPHFAAEMPSYG